MTDRELLEYIATQVGKLTQDVVELKNGQKGISQRVIKVETLIENDVSTKLDALQ
ncbi:MAG TPA: hypothetical protein VHT34_14890 [Clostridia bacterium]|nr:hypothetical protein [Clostridia bacterium]